MAIEDAYQLSLTLDEHVRGASSGQPVDIESALKNYQAVSVYLQRCLLVLVPGHIQCNLPCAAASLPQLCSTREWLKTA